METNPVNKTHKSRNHPRIFLLFIAFVVSVAAVTAFAAEESRQGEDLLFDIYQGNRARLAVNSFGLPLFLDSSERDGKVQVDVYGVFDYPLGSIVDALKVPANWCDIVSLHPNVKACTYKELPDDYMVPMIADPYDSCIIVTGGGEEYPQWLGARRGAGNLAYNIDFWR